MHRGRGRGRPIVGVDGQFRAWAVNGSRDVEGGETAGRGDCGEEEKAVARARAGEREEELLIGNMADLLNLEKQFAFYGAYHSNKLNVLVHMFFVWPIFFTSGILWAYTPAIIPLPLPAGTLPFQQYMILNVNFVIAGIYALYYAALDKKAGSLGAAICLGCWIGSQAIAESLPWSTAWKASSGLFMRTLIVLVVWRYLSYRLAHFVPCLNDLDVTSMNLVRFARRTEIL